MKARETRMQFWVSNAEKQLIDCASMYAGSNTTGGFIRENEVNTAVHIIHVILQMGCEVGVFTPEQIELFTPNMKELVKIPRKERKRLWGEKQAEWKRSRETAEEEV